MLVGVLQGAADFAGDLERGIERKLLFPRETLPERLPICEGHHVIEQAIGLSRVEQRQNVGVLKGRGDVDLAEEPIAANDGRQLRLEQLDGDRPVVLEVLGEKDDRHPAAAELALHVVSLTERCRELIEEFHGPPFPPRKRMCLAPGRRARRHPGPFERVRYGGLRYVRRRTPITGQRDLALPPGSSPGGAIKPGNP